MANKARLNLAGAPI